MTFLDETQQAVSSRSQHGPEASLTTEKSRETDLRGNSFSSKKLTSCESSIKDNETILAELLNDAAAFIVNCYGNQDLFFARLT